MCNWGGWTAATSLSKRIQSLLKQALNLAEREETELEPDQVQLPLSTLPEGALPEADHYALATITGTG